MIIPNSAAGANARRLVVDIVGGASMLSGSIGAGGSTQCEGRDGLAV
jgi:chemotaxis receptor (MCP) glutamine deamidase CheD